MFGVCGCIRFIFCSSVLPSSETGRRMSYLFTGLDRNGPRSLNEPDAHIETISPETITGDLSVWYVLIISKGKVAKMHMFHYDCISEWFLTSYLCPICKHPEDREKEEWSTRQGKWENREPTREPTMNGSAWNLIFFYWRCWWTQLLWNGFRYCLPIATAATVQLIDRKMILIKT